MPSAVKAATRSSIRTDSVSRPARSSPAAAIARAWEREPGASTTWRSPAATSASSSAVAAVLEGLSVTPGAGVVLVVRVRGAQLLLQPADGLLVRVRRQRRPSGAAEAPQELGIVVGRGA